MPIEQVTKRRPRCRGCHTGRGLRAILSFLQSGCDWLNIRGGLTLCLWRIPFPLQPIGETLSEQSFAVNPHEVHVDRNRARRCSLVAVKEP
jgi:hypothetical protein